MLPHSGAMAVASCIWSSRAHGADMVSAVAAAAGRRRMHDILEACAIDLVCQCQTSLMPSVIGAYEPCMLVSRFIVGAADSLGILAAQGRGRMPGWVR